MTLKYVVLLLLPQIMMSTIESCLKISLPRSSSFIESGSTSSVGTPRRSPRFAKRKHVSIVEPTFDEDGLTTEDEKDSPVDLELKGLSIIRPPHSILKIKSIKNYSSPLHLLHQGTLAELEAFYAQGVQLSIFDIAKLYEVLEFLLCTVRRVDKLKSVYFHDKAIMLDFILKSSLEITETVLEAIVLIMSDDPSVQEFLLTTFQSSLNSLYKCKALIFLHAVEFRTETVYNTLIGLLEEDSDSHLAFELMFEYNLKEGTTPLLIHAAINDSEDAVLAILQVDPSELHRLDKTGASVVYHAAAEGNFGVLEALKGRLLGRPIVGTCPLIGAARKNRDDTLNYFLVENANAGFLFTPEDFEEAAFASAIFGNFRLLSILLKNTSLNLYCHRGDKTLLSLSLENGQVGYAQRLVKDLKYDVNFVGDDPINPEGNAIKFLLEKYDSLEFFLKAGANLNVQVPDVHCGRFSDPEAFISLESYLNNCEDAKLIKLINKYK